MQTNQLHTGQIVIHTCDLNLEHPAYVKEIDGDHVNLDFFDGDEGWEHRDTLSAVPTLCAHCIGEKTLFGCSCNLTEDEVKESEEWYRFWCD